MKFVRLVLANAFRNRRRTTMTILAVASCLFLLATIRAFLFAMEEAAISESSKFRIITQHATSIANFLPEAYGPKIAKIPGVKAVIAGYWYQGVYIDENFEHWFGQMAVDAEGFREMFDDYAFDSKQYADWLADRTGFLACEELAKKQGWKIGQRISLRGTIFPFNAAHPPRDDEGARPDQHLLSPPLPRRGAGRPGRTAWYWVRVDDPTAVSRVTAEIDRMFENSPAPTHSMTEKQFNLQFVEMMGNVRGFLRNISIAILFTVLFVAVNAVSMSVRERTGEIAVMKALGFPGRLVLALVGAEIAVVAFSGAIVGAGGAWFLFNVLKWDAGGYAQNFSVPPAGLGIAAAAAAAIALAGLVPAWGAVRRPVVDALRRVA